MFRRNSAVCNSPSTSAAAAAADDETCLGRCSSTCALSPSSVDLRSSASSLSLNSAVRSKVRALRRKLKSPAAATAKLSASKSTTATLSCNEHPGISSNCNMATTAASLADSCPAAAAERQPNVLDRLRQTRKEIQADLNFFKGVAAKQKCELLPATANCLLDSILKLLLLLGDSKSCCNLDSPAIVDGHKKLLNALANLLRWTDALQIQAASSVDTLNADPENAVDEAPTMIDAAAASKCCHELDRAIAELLSLVGDALQHNDGLDIKEFVDSPIFSSSSESSIESNELLSTICNGQRKAVSAAEHPTIPKFPGSPAYYDPDVPPPKPPYPPQRLGLAASKQSSSNSFCSYTDSGIGLNASSGSSPSDGRFRNEQFSDTPNLERRLKPRLLFDGSSSNGATNGSVTIDNGSSQLDIAKLSLDELLHQLNLISGATDFAPSSTTATHSKHCQPNDESATCERDSGSDLEQEVQIDDEDSDESVEETEEMIDGCRVKVRKIRKKRRQVVKTKQKKETVVTFSTFADQHSTAFGTKHEVFRDTHEEKQNTSSMHKEVRSVKISNNSTTTVSSNGSRTGSTQIDNNQFLQMLTTYDEEPRRRREGSIPVLLEPNVDSRVATRGNCPIEASFRSRLPSSYENNESRTDAGSSQRQDSVNCDDDEKQTRIVSESKILLQTSSVQVAKQQKLVNGQLVAEAEQRKLDGNVLKASKSTISENGNLVHQSGSGDVAQTSYACRQGWQLPKHSYDAGNDGAVVTDEQTGVAGSRPRATSAPDQAPPLPPKRKQIFEYMQVIGQLPTECPSATYRKSALAAYSLMRDNWRMHEEALGHRAFSFQFSSNAPTKQESQQNGGATAQHSIDPEWTADTRDKNYEMLQNFINLSEHIQLPRALDSYKKKAIEDSRASPKTCETNTMCQTDVSTQLVYNREDNDLPEIRGGFLDVLIVHAAKTSTGQKDFLFQECFLTTYRTMLTPSELMKKLMLRYKHFSKNKSSISDRRASRNAFSLLVRVVDNLSSTELEEKVLSRLSEFVYSQIIDGDIALAKLLRQKMLEKLKQKQYAVDTKLLYVPLPVNSRAKSHTILGFKPRLVAEQLTYLDAYYFQQIDLSEMLVWSQEQNAETTPNLANFTEHFNKVSFWTRTKILAQPEAKDRERYLKHLLRVMKHLKELSNFNSLLALLSAMDSGPIRRLDWPSQYAESLKTFSCLIDSSQSFKNYRCALAESKPPCLPYIGLILQDLTFVHIGNPNFLPENLVSGRSNVINFGKRWQQFMILDSVRKFKSWSYSLRRNEKILSCFDNFDDFLTEDQLWSLSETIKPRGKTPGYNAI